MNPPVPASPAAGPPDPAAAHGTPPSSFAALSALADGQADALPQALRAWAESGQARQQWHALHLGGDVLRSDDLASPAGRDEAFLQKLRLRLDREPVPLAPQPLSVPAPAVRSRLRWRMPAAAMAGVVVVAGVLVLARPGGGEAGPALAGSPAPATAAPGAVLPGSPWTASAEDAAAQGALTRVGQSAGAVAVGGDMLALGDGAPSAATAASGGGREEGVWRDPRLQELLRVHQAARSGMPAPQPGGLLRPVQAPATMPVGATR